MRVIPDPGFIQDSFINGQPATSCATTASINPSRDEPEISHTITKIIVVIDTLVSVSVHSQFLNFISNKVVMLEQTTQPKTKNKQWPFSSSVVMYSNTSSMAHSSQVKNF